MNKYFSVLMERAESKLEEEYKGYCDGYKFVLANLIDGGTSVRYVEVQNKVVEVIKGSRQTANELNEYFESDMSLANSLIAYIIDKVAHNA